MQKQSKSNAKSTVVLFLDRVDFQRAELSHTHTERAQNDKKLKWKSN